VETTQILNVFQEYYVGNIKWKQRKYQVSYFKSILLEILSGDNGNTKLFQEYFVGNINWRQRKY
jgi:hypothetical protein